MLFYKTFIKRGDYNIVKLWKKDYLYKTFIGAIDYKINYNNIKIEYMEISNTLNDDDEMDANKSLIGFVKDLGKDLDKNKIIVDVHENLIVYHKYYMNEGFIITNNKCIDNPSWIQSEYIFKNNIKFQFQKASL